jgi:hypothetical protein
VLVSANGQAHYDGKGSCLCYRGSGRFKVKDVVEDVKMVAGFDSKRNGVDMAGLRLDPFGDTFFWYLLVNFYKNGEVLVSKKHRSQIKLRDWSRQHEAGSQS